MIDNMLNKQCIICNQTFFKAPTKSKTEWDKMKFCSRKCYWTSPHKKISTVDKVCPECNQTFSRKPKESVKQWDKKKFCSFHCNGKATLRGHKVWNKGIKLSSEQAYRCGNAMRGKKHRLETLIIMKERALRKEKHPLWIKDRNELKRSGQSNKDRRSSAYVLWRKDVLERDKWKCRIIDGNCEGKIEVHHILSYTEYPKLRYEINNGITLCKKHHPREKKIAINLIPYFKKIIS